MSSLKNIRFIETIKRMPLMDLPVRTTIVDIESARILISPGSVVSDADYRSLGEVTDIVIPNLFHTGGLGRALLFFPKAKVWLCPGADKAKNRVQNFTELNVKNWPYQDKLSLHFLEGAPKINEVVFVHRDSRSLIVTDLFFNLLQVRGLGSWIILHLFGTYRKFAMSKFFYSYVKDKQKFVDSLKRVMAEDFAHIIVSHGDNIESDAKGVMRQALLERPGVRV